MYKILKQFSVCIYTKIHKKKKIIIMIENNNISKIMYIFVYINSIGFDIILIL